MNNELSVDALKSQAYDLIVQLNGANVEHQQRIQPIQQRLAEVEQRIYSLQQRGFNVPEDVTQSKDLN